jgi:hypothetical protein
MNMPDYSRPLSVAPKYRRSQVQVTQMLPGVCNHDDLSFFDGYACLSTTFIHAFSGIQQIMQVTMVCFDITSLPAILQ